jgi:hypothetical protein
MKLIKEHINEKFEENSDPIHDLNIGISKLIEDFPENLIKLDYNQIYLKSYSSDMKLHKIDNLIRGISYMDNKIIINMYSDAIFDKNGKRFKKIDYIKNLIKKLKLESTILKYESHPLDNSNDEDGFPRYEWSVFLYVKSKFIKYYKEAISY